MAIAGGRGGGCFQEPAAMAAMGVAPAAVGGGVAPDAGGSEDRGFSRIAPTRAWTTLVPSGSLPNGPKNPGITHG